MGLLAIVRISFHLWLFCPCLRTLSSLTGFEPMPSAVETPESKSLQWKHFFWMSYGSSCYCQNIFSFMIFFGLFWLCLRDLSSLTGFEPVLAAVETGPVLAPELPGNFLYFSSSLLMEYKKLFIFVRWFLIGPPYWILLFLIVYQLIYLYFLGRKSYSMKIFRDYFPTFILYLALSGISKF